LRSTVPLAVAEFDSVAVLPLTELMVVPEGIPVPVTASPEARTLDGPRRPLIVAEPDVSVTSARSTFGPRLVSEPQSVILVESVAHQSR
jgi:hypothetical protein